MLITFVGRLFFNFRRNLEIHFLEKQKEHELFSEAVQLYHDQRLVSVYKKRLNRLKNKLID